MNELSIKIKIGGRDYPMKVNKDQEERIRMVAKLINEKLKSYQQQFSHDDMQDLLAMTALDCMVEKLISSDDKSPNYQSVVAKISHLNKLVSEVIP